MDGDVKALIGGAVGAASGSGVVLGATGADAPFLAGVWGGMMFGIANHYGVVLDKSACIRTCAGIIASIGAYKLGGTILTWAVNIATLGIATPVTLGLNGLLNGIFTFRLGCLFNELYGEDGCAVATLKITKAVVQSLISIPSYNEIKEFFYEVGKFLS